MRPVSESCPERRANGHIPSSVADQRSIRIDPALCTPYIAKPWLCARSSNCPTKGCGLFRSRSNRSMPASRSWSMTCSRPCMTRPASGSRRSRSASPSASSRWTCRRKRTITSRRCSSIRRSPGCPTKTATYEEGCLSIPEYYEEVERPAEVKVKYLDLDGKSHEIKAKGLLATCLQHEIDHINGVLFIDHLSKLKRDRVIKKFAKAAKHQEGGGVIGASPRLHGHARLRRAHAARACRRRP